MSYWKLYYHFVWGTKNRLALIDSSFEEELYKVIVAKVKDMESYLHAIGGTNDHIHIAVSVPPKIALSKFIGDVKGNSSHFVNHVVKPGFEFYWQTEYGALSFGERNLSSVVGYIHKQKERHAKGTLIESMEKMDEA